MRFLSPKALLLLVLCSAILSCKFQSVIPELDDKFITLPSGETMHYLEAGNPAGKTILFVHGYPSSAYLYRNVITRACEDPDGPYHCLAISQIGFGKSSCPGDGSTVGPLQEVEWLEEFVHTMGLSDAALVVHDWGGPIGTAAGLRNADLFSHLVILNTVLTFPQVESLQKIMDGTNQFFEKPRPIIEALYADFVGMVMQLMTTSVLSDEVLALYTEPFNKKTNSAALCRMHAGINLFSKANMEKVLFQEIETLSSIAWQDKPTVFLWSTNDLLLGANSPVGKLAHRDMEALFPQAETKIIKSADHFLQEDKPVEIADAITYFLGSE